MFLDWLVLAVAGLLHVRTAAYVVSYATLARFHMSVDVCFKARSVIIVMSVSSSLEMPGWYS